MISKFVSEQDLKKASTMVRCSMLETLPQEPEGQFSEDFHQRITELKKAQHKRKKQQQFRKRFVSAVAAFFVAVTMLLTFNTEVRAAVITWFKEVFDTHTVYWFSGEKPDTLPFFELTYIPEEYECVYDETLLNSRTTLYLNKINEADGFTFDYGFIQDESPLTVDYSGTEVTITEVTITGCTGNLYIPSDPGEAHALIWIDEPNGVVFTITAYVDPEVMLHIAESVKLVE